MLFLCGVTCPAQTGDVRRVHDPCIIKQDSHYYLFCTGNNIPIRRSKDLIEWERVGTVFQKAPEWAFEKVPGFRGHIWAPDISFWKGRYYLYYSISTFGKNRSCIGLAMNSTLNPQDPKYQWIDQGSVIESVPGKDQWNAIDPNLIVDQEKQPWLVFGSFWSGIKMVKLNPETLKPEKSPELLSLAARPGSTAIEAPFIIRHQDYYYLFISFDYCARGVNSTYKIMVGRSAQLQGPYRDKEDKPLIDGGGSLVLETHGDCRGPGHNAILQEGDKDWLVHHMYDAANAGIPTLQIRPITWDGQNWPIAGNPVSKLEAK